MSTTVRHSAKEGWEWREALETLGEGSGGGKYADDWMTGGNLKG